MHALLVQTRTLTPLFVVLLALLYILLLRNTSDDDFTAAKETQDNEEEGVIQSDNAKVIIDYQEDELVIIIDQKRVLGVPWFWPRTWPQAYAVGIVDMLLTWGTFTTIVRGQLFIFLPVYTILFCWSWARWEAWNQFRYASEGNQQERLPLLFEEVATDGTRLQQSDGLEDTRPVIVWPVCAYVTGLVEISAWIYFLGHLNQISFAQTLHNMLGTWGMVMLPFLWTIGRVTIGRFYATLPKEYSK